MSSIPSAFTVERKYVIHHKSAYSNGPILLGGVFPDTKEGKHEAERKAKELQDANDAEQNQKPKRKQRK